MILLFIVFCLISFEVECNPIETPEFDERNKFAIQSPLGWGYRTFCGENGLIAVLWPAGTSFNVADTAVFVFLQDANTPLPAEPENINIFREKCEKADFKFASGKNNGTLSIAENYFSGRCGRTMILLKEQVEQYTVVVAFVSARYVTKSQLSDVKKVVALYKKEIRQYIDEHKTQDIDEDAEKPKVVRVTGNPPAISTRPKLAKESDEVSGS